MEFYATIIAIIIIYIFFSLKLNTWQKARKDRIYEDEIISLRNKFPGILESDSGYKYYTNGHPYVWVESSYTGFLESIKYSAEGYRGMPQTPIYSIKVDDNSKSIYFVNRIENFDFNQLMHYQEWIDSNKQVSENIREYKNSYLTNRGILRSSELSTRAGVFGDGKIINTTCQSCHHKFHLKEAIINENLQVISLDAAYCYCPKCNSIIKGLSPRTVQTARRLNARFIIVLGGLILLSVTTLVTDSIFWVGSVALVIIGVYLWKK